MKVIKKIWDFIFDENYGYEPPIYDLSGQSQSPNSYNQKRQPHLHDWKFWSTFRHNWNISNGKIVGTRYPIDAVIAAIKDCPGHTETLLLTVEGWKREGYKYCHSSWNVNKCKSCNEIRNTEFYVAPIKEDGSGYYSYTNNNNNTYNDTTTITVIRREVPIEPMKRYK